MQYVIIGAGPAGVTAAETLRSIDLQANITIIGNEPEPPYSRMAIPYYLIGNVSEQGCYLREDQHQLAGERIEVKQGWVKSIDTVGQQVLLDDQTHIAYDKLLIATGSHPKRPPVAGMDHPLVSSCWTLEDARTIIANTPADTDVVLIGAGFIGCIILEALVKRGVKLSVVESGNRMVPRMLNEKAGGLLKNWCQDKGVNVLTSTSVDSLQETTDGKLQVNLSNGEQLSAGLVITATGVHPNTDLLDSTAVKTDSGVLVNRHLQSSDENIYAAGDVAQGMDFSTGNYEVQAIQPTATDHGRIAALNMAGMDCEHQGSLNMNVLDTLGLISHSFGLWMGVEGGDSCELYAPDDYRYLNLQFDGDCLVGASCTGMTQHIGILRGLIESKVSLGEWKARLMKQPTAFVEAYMACTQELSYL